MLWSNFHKQQRNRKTRIKEICPELKENEKLQHDSLITLRHKFYAHNDPENNNIQISYNKTEGKIKAIPQYGFHHLAPEKDLISDLIDSVSIGLKSMRDKLIGELFGSSGKYAVNEQQAFTLFFSKNHLYLNALPVCK